MHQFADALNACFELAGAFFICFSIRKLWFDKKVRGISWIHVAFFAAWGWWNIIYYWAVNSPLSWWAGIAVTLVNTGYLAMLIYYTRTEDKELLPWKQSSY